MPISQIAPQKGEKVKEDRGSFEDASSVVYDCTFLASSTLNSVLETIYSISLLKLNPFETLAAT